MLPGVAGGALLRTAGGGRWQWGHFAGDSVGCKSESLREMPSAQYRSHKQGPLSVLWLLSLPKLSGSRKQAYGGGGGTKVQGLCSPRAGGWGSVMGLVPL